ncbi:hypothetical protein CPB83DRAFT_741216, partial [Crepidotus variabilis]
CRITEIIQHTCEVRTDLSGQPSIQCFPIARIFKLCPNLPALEITRFVKLDKETGEVEIPPNLSPTSVQARSWRDVTLYSKK